MSTRHLQALSAVAIAVAALALSPAASALPVPVVGYDVAQTPAAGFGLWSHSYTGTVVDTGRLVGGSIGCPCRIVNEAGGGGTLNDGTISTRIDQTHLFTTRNALDGLPIAPTITLRLAATARIEEIRIHGGNLGGTIIQGALDGATVEIGGSSVHLPTAGTGTLDVLDLRSTPLAAIPTDRIVLRNFTARLFGFAFDQFSITEITVEGTVADTTPPVLDVPDAPVVVPATQPDGAVVEYVASADDDVDGPLTPACVPASGSVFPIGDTRVTCTAADLAGNVASASFDVHVRGAPEQLAELAERISSIAGLSPALQERLELAARHLSADRPSLAAGALDWAVAKLRKAVVDGLVSEADGAALIADAERIKAVIGVSAEPGTDDEAP